eukprot:Em0018g284a
MASVDEKAPLVGGPAIPSAPPMEAPPAYEELPTQVQNGPPPPSGGGNPPPYMAAAPPSVQCRVCQSMIVINRNTPSRIVRCNNCREATPIGAAPPGSKYVRCLCNCLLTCSVTATRVVCPRPNCKRVIGVGTIRACPATTAGRLTVSCGVCNRSILWPRGAGMALCPHCGKKSYINSSWLWTRILICLILALILLAGSVAIIAVTVTLSFSGGVYAVPAGSLITGGLFFLRGIFYCTTPQSHVLVGNGLR